MMPIVRSFAKRYLPKRVYHALAVLKNGIPQEAQPALDPLSAPEVSLAMRPEDAPRLECPSGVIAPSMIKRSEAEFFSECARGPLPAEGMIVDLGCFMGSTAIALARGLVDSDRRRDLIAYDLFEWANWMNGAPTHGAYLPGDCFLPEARGYVRDSGYSFIKVERADLSGFEWGGERIALLLVDAMKAFDIAAQIGRSFFPALVPGAVLIHQDFKHYWTSWIHLLHYRLRDHFELIHSVSDAGTVAFRVTSPITREEVAAKSELEHATDDEIDAAFRYSMSLLPLDETVNVAAAHAMHYRHLGQIGKGYARLEGYRAAGLADRGEFIHMIAQHFPTHQAALSA
jgi:hypothetical protein